MKFEPAPDNSFLPFMRAYHDRCRERIPQIRAVAAKWTFEDLIPGLSDFDTRFIVDDAMRLEDWRSMSLAVGEVHTEMCRQFPQWARNLEHLPGVNLTVAEFTDPRLFYPEFAQWTFYEGDAETLGRVERYLADAEWSQRDELHHLRKFSTYFGPYCRGIDPPINVGRWESKYPLHSRYMHYFAPPVQSAVSLALKRNVKGKLEALRLARELFPRPATIDRLLEAIECHYEIPEVYVEPGLSELEGELEQYLHDVWAALDEHITLVRAGRNDSADTVRAKVATVPLDPLQAFFESAKFGRLLKGRLLFYAETIPHFDSTWLIRNEIARSVPNFYTRPLTIYGRVRFGEPLSPEQVLEKLSDSLLLPDQCAAMRRFARVASEPLPPNREREQSLRVANAYDIVPAVMDVLSHDLLARAAETPASRIP